MAATMGAGFITGLLTTSDAIELIEAARAPADLFGSDAARRYRRLARLTHPDAQPGDARAVAAFAKLADLWHRHAQVSDSQVSGPAVARGDLANFYHVRTGLLKVARKPADNDLIDREAAALGSLARHVPARLGAYFPRLAEVRRVGDPITGAERRGNVLAALDGFISLAEIRRRQPGGIDPRDAAWMWRRLLVALGAAHRAGMRHGAVLPEHGLLHPADPGHVLVDCCYSGRPEEPLPAIVGRYRDWYPPETLSRGSSGPATDIWLATHCMTALMAIRMPAALRTFARGCQLANAARRPQDAWQLLAELDDLLEQLYGPRKFRPFVIPA
ncbi:MAG: molecular chaperone DnaJ [Nocardiopsaceae bacterium]|jgi:hypothetical protein|nr:molecular chaperone DnaJ [Nocardiopsaceae bacterium]